MQEEEKIELAEILLTDFADRTGLDGQGDENERYLWTDAFAVQAFFGLYHISENEKYKEIALHLIELVHRSLGRFREDDSRDGWISGLSEEEGEKHPTKGGLRIGKDLPERKEGESFDARLEWGRDGQYYHYLTRWMATLLRAFSETDEQKYARWAAELMEVSEQFIEKDKGRLRMYWKMSTDLSRPLVDSMGAQDALEGAILARSIKQAYPPALGKLESLIRDMDKMCEAKNWATGDPLGIGGLLLKVGRVLSLDEEDLRKEQQAGKLYRDAIRALQLFKAQNSQDQLAYERLPFRECGLSLGLRILEAKKSDLPEKGVEMEPFFPVAEEIETFWSQSNHQKVHTWTEHLDINAVGLASSLIARQYPHSFCP
jgi:hypothetical protein